MENYDAKIEDIIEYLNIKSGKNYKAETLITRRMISSRLDDGYTVSDFLKIIDNKTEQWKGTEMENYLRPKTLFGLQHFEDYLQEEPFNKPKPYKEELLTEYDITDIDKRFNDIVKELRCLPYSAYLQTEHWKHFKEQAIKNAHSECQVCGCKDKELNVHHKTYENRGRETFLDVIVLCEDCHAKFHNK